MMISELSPLNCSGGPPLTVADASAGRGCVVVVTAEAGGGKTALLDAFCAAHAYLQQFQLFLDALFQLG